MFTGYNLKIDKRFFDNKPKSFDRYQIIGEQHLSTQVHKYKRNLYEYIIDKETINGNELQNANFPIVDADIFISHSHNDEQLANALAGWINEEFGLSVFIDSNVWEYSNDLLRDINSEYSNKRVGEKGNFVYDYGACNIASQHVNIMLSVALQKMIDKVECVILLNTDESINIFDRANKKIAETYSPWIYSEIICTQIVRKKPLLYYRKYDILSHSNDSVMFDALRNLKISYNVSIKHLINLNEDSLINWEKEYKDNIRGDYEKYPLDALYCFTHQDELEYTRDLYAHIDCAHINCLEFIMDQYYDYQHMDENDLPMYLCEEMSDSICSVCRGEKCIFRRERRGFNE